MCLECQTTSSYLYAITTMQFVAYYIETNGFGIKNQTINLGGKYFYTLTKKTKGKLEIHRTPNPKYIPNFYGDKNLTLLSAVVGRNGTGKTSLLIDIIESISGNRGSSNFLIFENNDEVSVFFGNVDNGQGISGNVNWHIETPKNFKLKILNGNIASVYYSPHLDSRAGVPGIDLSFANIIYQDLDEKQDLVRHTNSLNPIKEHEFSNFNRLLTFFNSNLSQKLYESFNLPKPSRIKISFSLIGRVFTDTGYAKLNNFHNMPDEFVEPLNVILGKIETERKNRRGSSFSISAQKERLKHYILWGMLSAIVDVGERDNKYLEEGILPPGFIEKTKDLNAIDTFYYFLEIGRASCRERV